MSTVFIGAFLTFHACSTLDKAAVRDTDKAAVALIGVNKHLDFDDEFGAGVQIVQKLAQSDKFDLEPIRKDLHKKTFNEYNEFLPFELMNEEDVIGSKAYKEFTVYDDETKEENFRKGGDHFLQKEGYLPYLPTSFSHNQDRRKSFFKTMPDNADAMLMIELSYDLDKQNSMVPGVSKGKVKANLHMILSDEKGEKIMKIIKTATSEDDVKVVLNQGIPDPDKIQPMCADATEKVMEKAETFIKEELSAPS